MTTETIPPAANTWRPTHAYIMAALCLVVGLAVGYLFRGSQSTQRVVNAASKAPVNAPQHQMPSLDQMKRMAASKADPLLQQLKADPKNSALLVKVGDIYTSTHQFQEAESYYRQALAADPKNVTASTELASCFYYRGDVDGAIAQLQESLKLNPRHEGTLFNLGVMKWKGKADGAGAVTAWQQLLTLNPETKNKPGIEKLIADARQHPAGK